MSDKLRWEFGDAVNTKVASCLDVAAFLILPIMADAARGLTFPAEDPLYLAQEGLVCQRSLCVMLFVNLH